MPILSLRLPTSGDSSSSSQSKTITILNLGKIKNITADTGNVTYELLGDGQVKINISGGSYVRRVYNSKKYSKYVTGQTSTNYDKDGYTGTLTRYLYSGSYTPSDSKEVTTSRKVSTDIIINTQPGDANDIYYKTYKYDVDGYVGTLPIVHAIDGGSVYFLYYRGIVTKPASDTRVYRYKGTVYKGGYNYYYAYNITIEYEEDSKTYLKINNEYKKTQFYLKQNGIYVKVAPYLKVNNEYKKV